MIKFKLDSRYETASPEKKEKYTQIKDDSVVEIFKNQVNHVSIRIGSNVWMIRCNHDSHSIVVAEIIHKLASNGYRIIQKESLSGTLQRDRESVIYLSKYPVIPKKIDGERIVEPSTGTCFIATAAYGSSLSPQVMELKCFRDDVLLNYRIGKLVVKYYELVSPPIAYIIGKSHVLQCAVRNMIIRPLIFILKLVASFDY